MRKNVNFEKEKKCVFLMSQGSLNPKIRFLGQKVCPVSCLQTDRQADRHTHRVTTEGTFKDFRIFFLLLITKDWLNIYVIKNKFCILCIYLHARCPKHCW